MANEPVRILRCPTCRKPVVWSIDSRHRPFCSERCRLIDLGEWANEEKRIPAEDNVQVDDEVSSQDEP